MLYCLFLILSNSADYVDFIYFILSICPNMNSAKCVFVHSQAEHVEKSAKYASIANIIGFFTKNMEHERPDDVARAIASFSPDWLKYVVKSKTDIMNTEIVANLGKHLTDLREQISDIPASARAEKRVKKAEYKELLFAAVPSGWLSYIVLYMNKQISSKLFNKSE